MAGSVGTLGVAIRADASGMAAGFQKSKREIDGFARQLSSASNRMTSSLTMVATHFAVVGKTGPEQLKQVATAGIGLAAVFGPTGALVSGIGLVGITIVNWMTKAREEAKATEEAFRKLATTFSLSARVEGVRAFDADPKKGGALSAMTQQLEDFQARATRLQQKGVSPTGLLGDIDALKAKMQPLIAQRQRLVDLVTQEAQSGQQLRDATAQVARHEAARAASLQASANASREILASLSGLAPPSALPHWSQGLKGGIVGADASGAIARQQQAAQAVVSAANEAAAALKMEFVSALHMASQSLISMGAQLAGGGMFAGIGAKAGGGIGGRLLGGLIGTTFGGPLGAALGGVAGGFIGKAVGGAVRGIGRLFGFGKKKGPSPEELAARQLEQLAKQAHEVGQQLLNMPKGFKVAIAEFASAIGVRLPGPHGDSAGSPPSDQPPVGGDPTDRPYYSIQNMTVVANSPEEFHRQMQRGRFTTDRGGVSGLSFALAPR